MPSVMMTRSDGVVGVPGPFHWPTFFGQQKDFFVDTGNLATQTYDLPPCQKGDILLAIVGADGGTGSVTFPAASPDQDGWVTLKNEAVGQTGVRLIVAAKIADESDSDSTVDAACSPSRETAVSIVCLQGAQHWDNWIWGSAQGGTVNPITWGAATAPATNRYLALAMFANDDNRSSGSALAEDYENFSNAQVPGGSINGVSVHAWRKDAIVAASDSEAPTTEPSLSDNQEWTSLVVLIPTTDGDLYESQQAVDNINNPGAEDTTNFWTTTTGSLGNRGATPDPHGGASYFYGGAVALTIAHQDIDIPSELHTFADQNRLRVGISWWQNSFQGSDDGVVNLYWLDDQSPENVIGEAAQVPEAAPNQVWTQRTCFHAAPAGARALRIEFECRRDAGTNNDAYFDDFSGIWYVDAA